MDKNRRRAMLSWLFVGALFVLCGVLAVLQYRWIGEVSVAERERLQQTLQASLNRISQAFNSELASACRALAPADSPPDVQVTEAELAARYERWKKTSRHTQIFRRIALAAPRDESVVLQSLDLQRGTFSPAEWPANWGPIERRLESRLRPDPRRNPLGFLGRGPDGAAGGFRGPPRGDEGLVFELPLMRLPPAGGPPGRFRRETQWLIFELNLQYVREILLPEMLQSHLGSDGGLDYQVEVVTKTSPPAVIYQSDPAPDKRLASTADASVSLFEPPYELIFRRFAPPGVRDRGPGPPGDGPGRRPGPDLGRWQMFVRHRAGSLEAVVSRARWRNLAVTSGVLLLMMASVAALIRYTRRAQKLAELQMDFVAGVSHELRTPLTVIHTAAYNLRGKLAQNPSQVERYGTLIQQESGRLKDLVEQVLQFARSNAGRVIQEPEPLSVETVIEETMEASKTVIQGARCVVEKSIDPDLPVILGDPLALKQALQNLLSNAAKYGTEGDKWIGVFASKTTEKEQPLVEIRVADHGPGIPPDEQEHIFDPFFRGRRAVQDQVHGTGLGLSLVKKIVEAHGGSIRVQSEPLKGTEFIVLLPAAPNGAAA